MLVMPANHSGMVMGYLAGRFPGALGHLFSPGHQRGPWPFLPYALDNGAYGAFTAGKPWEFAPWSELLEWAKATGIAPRWTLVPDKVGDWLGTLRMWQENADYAASFGWPLAFAVQDGMRAVHVPSAAKIVFVGGSTDWKWSTLQYWTANFPRVHVGRVNTKKYLEIAAAAGAESCDGTGWFRGRKEQLRGLLQWLEDRQPPHGVPSLLSYDGIEGLTAPGSRSSKTGEPAGAGAGK